MGEYMNKYSICIITTYFDKFPNYFQFFLNSCKFNESIEWIIFTDIKDLDGLELPPNVRFINVSWNDYIKLLKKKFSFEINISSPIKACDFRPAYGYIFSDYIEKFDFWGYCDVDLIFGDIRKFLTDEVLDKHDKVLELGHISLFRNTENINKMFMREYKGEILYKNVFQNKIHLVFEENYHNNGGGINGIFQQYKIPIYKNDKIIADVNFRYNNFVINSDFKNRRKKCVFLYDSGRLLRFTNHKEKIETSEYLYVHFQKRRMQVISEDTDRFIISPRGFIEFPKVGITKDFINDNNGLITRYYYPYIKIKINRLKLKVIKIRGKLFIK